MSKPEPCSKLCSVTLQLRIKLRLFSPSIKDELSQTHKSMIFYDILQLKSPSDNLTRLSVYFHKDTMDVLQILESTLFLALFCSILY